MKIYVLRLDDEYGGLTEAFSTRERAEVGKQLSMQAWLDADCASMFDPRRSCPEEITDPVESYLWRCGISYAIEELELDAPLRVPPGLKRPTAQP